MPVTPCPAHRSRRDTQQAAAAGRFGRRLVYGGHVISLARALLFNGLANAFKVAAPNGGRHIAPTFANDTIYAWSKVLEKTPLSRRADLGALRIRTAGDHPIGAMESSRVLHLMPKVRQTGAVQRRDHGVGLILFLQHGFEENGHLRWTENAHD